MINGYLLDTNICIYLLKRKYGVAQKLNTLSGSNIYISEITLAELCYGANKSIKKDEMLEEVDFLASLFPVLPITECIKLYGENKSVLEKNGKRIDDFDLLIGSTAVQHNLTVVTENVKHLGRIPGIKIENWIVRDK